MSVHLRRYRETLPVQAIPNDIPKKQRPSPRYLHSLLHLASIQIPRLPLSLGLAVVLCLCFLFGLIELSQRALFGNTLVFQKHDLQRIWQWEIAHGHHPSHQKVPTQIGLRNDLDNPALPLSNVHALSAVGIQRQYIDLSFQAKLRAHPPRPLPGSAADLDIIFSHCDFSQGKLVKDCLAFLRGGAGLESGRPPRTGNAVKPSQNPRILTQGNQYIFTVEGMGPKLPSARKRLDAAAGQTILSSSHKDHPTDSPFLKGNAAQWESLPTLQDRPKPMSPHGSCDPENPRIFHMYWTGSFNDKPYLSLLSFLYTQNLGLSEQSDPRACRPQLWFWINPGPAAALTSPLTTPELHEELQSNKWAAPFLHPRFADIIQFKVWDTTERLDSIPELKHDWRNLPTIFNSGGTKIYTSYVNGEYITSSSKEYDRLSATLSDVARFILCHEFGGIYLDTDSLFLRDWEDLWGWGGAFTYRWSFHNAYNTAVLRLNKRSAIGTFILRTALKNDMDFHPMSVSKYMKEASLASLLYRLPDALFDSAWLNTEGYQRDNPPHPYIPYFPDFFEQGSAHGETFDQFFKGAYSYHYHNSWSSLVDPAQHQPNLGAHFWSNMQEFPSGDTSPIATGLSWSASLKRTFEEFIRGDRPNMYGEDLRWEHTK